jgi:adenine deaminase
VSKGIDTFNVLKAACVNPVLHYKLDVGLLKEGDPADFILVEDLIDFNVVETRVDGVKVAENGRSLISNNALKSEPLNTFNCSPIAVADLQLLVNGDYPHPLIEALDGQLITNKVFEQPAKENGCYVADPSRDILKMVVVNRYHDHPPAIAFITNTGIKQGAIASSVAHDSHNIVAVGTDDDSIMKAVNLVIRHKGGVSIAKDNLEMILPLPIAGLMSDEDGYKVAELYSIIDRAAKEAGSTLRSPFMTLSFMALLVIPHLKLSDKGLFDGDSFMLLD